MASLSINTLRRMSICKSQAWKDTQRILKRSGLVYRGERSESFDPEKHFNRYTVRYLYLLNIIALKIRSVREGANKQVISSQADSLIKISRIWADFFPANTSNQPI